MQQKQVFDTEFGVEMARSERQRALALVGVCFGILIGFLLGGILFSNALMSIFHDRPPYGRMLAVITGMTTYAILMWFIMGKLIEARKSVPPILRYLSALAEISIPSLIMIISEPIVGSIYVLDFPPMLMYFVFIALTVLRLDPRLSTFSGIMAAAQYLALAGIFLRGEVVPAGSEHLLNPLIHFGKAGILIVTGTVTGIVTRDIQRRVANSLHVVEERNRVVGLFGQHVSPAVVDQLLAQTDVDGEMRPVCVMFLDIRGFTAFSEDKDPREVVAYLNRLFDPLIEIVNQHHGIVNKFLGDGFMAVFGAPLEEGDPRRNAISAALEIVRYIDAAVGAEQVPPTRIGIGLHAGDAVTGTVGSAVRKEYTIIGDVVNIAARIEQLNKQYDSRLLVSGRVIEGAAHPAESLGVIEIRGHQAGVEIYRLA